MKITVLNGSPKGELSVTLQYAKYLEKRFPQHEFHVLHIAQRIKQLENDGKAFDAVIAQVAASDGVIWGFPLYILLVHAHYKRFIELIFERGAQAAFAGKYAATLSTSIHFFDHTAHHYMHAICDDLDMRFVDSFSADMNDLMEEKNRRQLTLFGQRFIQAMETRAAAQREYAPLVHRQFSYQPGQPLAPLSAGEKRVVILHDEKDPDSNLFKMVARARARISGDVTLVNLHDIEIKASCQGCLRCGSAYHCAFEGKDAFIDFYKNTVMTADVLIFAGRIVDRSLSSRWKMVLDRAFFNTHTPVLGGKQLAWLVSGPLAQVSNLREVLQAYYELQGANLVGIVTDENGTSAEMDAVLDQLVETTLRSAVEGAERPKTFLGIGGLKLFRDDMYGRLRMVFPADFRAYRRMGLYKTFPQANLGMMLLNTFVSPLVNLPSIRRRFDDMMKEQMVLPLKQVVEKAG